MSATQLPVQTAQDLCGDWRNLSNEDKGSKIGDIKGFLIPKDAVSDLKDNSEVEAIRVYLAYDESADEVKLVVVGTKANASTGVQEDIIGTSPDTEIYDFTTPCPSTCDPNSPLY
jgi:hypothetical protein